jgi:hypothetical protein
VDRHKTALADRLPPAAPSHPTRALVQPAAILQPAVLVYAIVSWLLVAGVCELDSL